MGGDLSGIPPARGAEASRQALSLIAGARDLRWPAGLRVGGRPAALGGFDGTGGGDGEVFTLRVEGGKRLPVIEGESGETLHGELILGADEGREAITGRFYLGEPPDLAFRTRRRCWEDFTLLIDLRT